MLPDQRRIAVMNCIFTITFVLAIFFGAGFHNSIVASWKVYNASYEPLGPSDLASSANVRPISNVN
jgi:hypothetical protein